MSRDPFDVPDRCRAWSGRACAGGRHRRPVVVRPVAGTRAMCATRRSWPRRRGRPRAFPAADEDFFHDMDQTRDGPPVLTPDEVRGPQHLDRLERRQRSDVGSARRDQRRRARLRQGPVVAPVAALQPGLHARPPGQRQLSEPLGVSRPGQRAVLREGRRRPTPTAGACGSTGGAPAALPDPFENAAEVPRRGGRIARRDAEREALRDRLLLRLRHRHRRLPAVPQPRLRRARRARWDRRALLHRSARTTTTRRWSVRIASACRAAFCHVGPNPIQPAGRSRTTRSGPTSARTSARSTSGSIGSSTEAANLLELRVPAVPHVAARIARHFVRSRPTTSTTRGR